MLGSIKVEANPELDIENLGIDTRDPHNRKSVAPENLSGSVRHDRCHLKFRPGNSRCPDRGFRARTVIAHLALMAGLDQHIRVHDTSFRQSIPELEPLTNDTFPPAGSAEGSRFCPYLERVRSAQPSNFTWAALV
jgi:hypothetical protein